MRVFCIGDVVGNAGCEHIARHLPNLKRNKKIDLTIANGENSADGNGILPSSAEKLFNSGIDIITTGNHAFRRGEIYDYFEENEFLLRPENFPKGTTPGRGHIVFSMGKYQACVINIMGTVYMEPLHSPFETADLILSEIPPSVKIILIDFHAEATAEKIALARYLDGRVSAVFGTHTHVQTSDIQIFPMGTGYITDLGMTGPVDSVLGIKIEKAIEKMKTKMPVRFETAEGRCAVNGALFEIDPDTGKCTAVENIIIN